MQAAIYQTDKAHFEYYSYEYIQQCQFITLVFRTNLSSSYAIYDLKHLANENSRNCPNALKTAKKLLILSLSCKTKFTLPL